MNNNTAPKSTALTTNNALATGLSKALTAFISQTYFGVLRAVASKIHAAYKNNLSRAEAEDIACESVVYAINALDALEKQDPKKVTKDAWINLGMFKARCLANSDHRRRAAGHEEALYIDAPMAGEAEEGASPEAACIVRESMEAWRGQTQDADRAAYAKQVYAGLKNIYAKCGISKRSGEIFTAYYLEQVPPEKVASAFGVSRNVVYVTASRVCEKLAEFGPAAVMNMAA